MRSEFTVDQLVNVSREDFEQTLRDFQQLDDYAMEGYAGPTAQRDLSVRFRWGHNHDFGTFAIEGEMQNRHLWLLSTFIDEFGLTLPLNGRRVLDIGPWTGGTSLLLHALGAQVVAIEEVRKYAQALQYLANAFGLDNLTVINRSLFECVDDDFQDTFDLVLFTGVLYHVSDPIVALRHTFNALRDGGICLIETYAIDNPEPVLLYEGANVFAAGTLEARNRVGWNWFRPSPAALAAMLSDVGFAESRIGHVTRDNRLLAIARRDRHRDMLRAGLSVPGLR